ncbi:MAG: ATP-dependent RNA helicase, partial [Candidatus Accumulibacter sp.]|nr:ATP-dependent RNA helicase [Accumulibacter sp.]
EPFDGMIIFARTKLGTEELATKLQARGFAAVAINGDMAQQARERTIEQLKNGKIDILVATDVAARGLDVERISHVINYDVPSDPESYTHRIGRTGRAGRSGDAILFITPRERGLLKAIERATRQPVAPLQLPTVKAVNDVRIAKFKDQITEILAAGGLEQYRSLIEEYEREQNVPAVDIAAALAKLGRGDVPLLLEKPDREAKPEFAPREQGAWEDRPARPPRDTRDIREQREPAFKKERVVREPEPGMQTFRIEVGHQHGVKPGNIVGAIANEANMPAKYMGRIEIYDDFSTIDLPDDMPQDLVDHLKTVWVAGQQLNMTRDGEALAAPSPKKKGFTKPGADRRMAEKGVKKPHRKG